MGNIKYFTDEERLLAKKLKHQRYYEKNKEKLKMKTTEYREKNKEKEVEKCRVYRQKNKEKRRIYQQEYRKKNKEEISKKRKEYVKNKYKTDVNFRITILIRSIIRQSFKTKKITKKNKTQDILGCSFEEFKDYIESKWENWMTWDNHGNPNDGTFEPNKTWDIDHIIPLSSAINECDVIRLNHFTNLQPLCSYNNRWIKSDSHIPVI